MNIFLMILLVSIVLWVAYAVLRPAILYIIRLSCMTVCLIVFLPGCGTLQKLYKPPPIQVVNEIVCAPPLVDKIDLAPITWTSVYGADTNKFDPALYVTDPYRALQAVGRDNVATWISLSVQDYEALHSNNALIWQQAEQMWAVILFYRDCIDRANAERKPSNAETAKVEKKP